MNKRQTLFSLIVSTILTSGVYFQASAVSIDSAVKAGSFALSQGKEILHGTMAAMNTACILNFSKKGTKYVDKLFGMKVGTRFKNNPLLGWLTPFIISPSALYRADDFASQNAAAWATEGAVLLTQAYLVYVYAYKDDALKAFNNNLIVKNLTLWAGDKKSAQKIWDNARIKYPIASRIIEELPTTIITALLTTAVRHGVGSLVGDLPPLKK